MMKAVHYAAKQERNDFMAGIKAPPETWSVAKKIQYYLEAIGFHTGGVDGLFGVRSSSGLILMQYYLNKDKVTGLLDTETLNTVKATAESGITYDKVRLFAENNWRKGFPSEETSCMRKNGHLSVESMVRIPTSTCGDAFAEKETSIAWAMLVKSALEFNEKADVKNRLDTNNFAAAGPYAAYRPYHYQVEAYINYRHGGNPAACPTFTKGGNNIIRANRFSANNSHAETWIRKNWVYFSNDGKWNDVPDNATSEGGPLEGYGHSDHGWGLAIDFCTGGEKSGRSFDGEVRWLEQNAEKFGFHPLLDYPPVLKDGSHNYKETWHWSYQV